MDVWWNAEFSWDGANLQTSIDAGATWQTLGIQGQPYNWYTDNTINGSPGGSQLGWTGRNASTNGSNGWQRAVHSLAGLAGQAEVLVRVNFGSDASVTDDGFAFDRFSLGNQPVVYLGPDTTICDSFLIDAGPANSYAWSTGATSQSISVQSAGTYTVTVFDNLGFPSADAIFIQADPPRNWDLGNDSILCNTTSFTIQAGQGLPSYLWQDGSTNAQLIATQSGTYWVTATSAAGCTQTDTLHLTFSPLVAGIGLPFDTLCRGQLIQFNDASAAATSWYWDFGNGNLSINQNPSTTYTAGGTYLVQLQVSDGICTANDNRWVFVDICTNVTNNSNIDIQIYPNPANESFQIQGLSQLVGMVEIRLYSIDGKVIFHQHEDAATISQSFNVTSVEFPAGTYLLEILNENERWSGKLNVIH